jgi:hypothetical protein
LYVPAFLGVPAIFPVLEFKVSPGGRLPVWIENRYGGMPPDATSGDEYFKPISPVPHGHARASGATAIINEQLAVAVSPFESVTVAV